MEPAISHPEQDKELVSGQGHMRCFCEPTHPPCSGWEVAPIHRDAPPGQPGAARGWEHTGLLDILCVPAQPSPGTTHCYLCMPCRSLKLSFSSGCCGLPALSMNTRRDGALLRTCQQDGKEKFTYCREPPAWGFRLLLNAVRKPESILGKADAEV